jgi:hypothetical protein
MLSISSTSLPFAELSCCDNVPAANVSGTFPQSSDMSSRDDGYVEMGCHGLDHACKAGDHKVARARARATISQFRASKPPCSRVRTTATAALRAAIF